MGEKIPSDVSIVRCGGYNSGQTFDAVRQAVDLLGGMQTFVKPGNRVLIKPNLLNDTRRRLEIQYRDCIRCFRCQEFCPRGAISVGRGWALKMAK